MILSQHATAKLYKIKIGKQLGMMKFLPCFKIKHGHLFPNSQIIMSLVLNGFFCLKRKVDGSIERCKARLVAKDFNQRYGIDYHKTFSPVIKPTIICTILSLVVTFKWPNHLATLIHQNLLMFANLTNHFMALSRHHELSFIAFLNFFKHMASNLLALIPLFFITPTPISKYSFLFMSMRSWSLATMYPSLMLSWLFSHLNFILKIWELSSFSWD